MAAIATVPQVIDDTLKLRFADAFARSKNAANAALSVFANPSEALRASQTLPFDPVVVAELDRLKEEYGDEYALPSKARIALEIYERAMNSKDDEDYAKLMQLHCSMRGLIERPGTNVDVNVQVSNVMVVKDLGTDEEWAAKAARQQRELTIDAR